MTAISSRTGRAAAAGPVGVEEFAARFARALVGVGAGVIALGFEQVGREDSFHTTIQRRNTGGSWLARARLVGCPTSSASSAQP